jgi:hypothetical protein
MAARAAAVSDVINAHPVIPSWLQHVPGIRQHYRYFLPFLPGAICAPGSART